MLTPTHIQIAVLHTKDLISKGKNGTNDAFIIFALGKQKFQSSIKEKATTQLLEWNEGCDIAIPPSDSNKSEVVLKVHHKASLGDKFLGRVVLPLSQFDVLTKPKSQWYPLKPKSGSEKDTKHRGEIEVKISFLIKPTLGNGSTNDLASKTKHKDGFRSSLGSILSLGTKKKKDKSGHNMNSSKDSLSMSSSIDSLHHGNTSSRINLNSNLPVINDDPGVISEEEDDRPLNMKIDHSIKNSSTSLRGSLSSLPTTPKPLRRSGVNDIFDENDEYNLQDDVPPSPKSPSTNRSRFVPSPKQKKFQLPSVIVEEESLSPPTFEALTAPPTPEPPKRLKVSASMSNLTDGSSGKGVRKAIKSMFTSSKHLSVDDVHHTAYNGGSGSSSSHFVQNQSQKSPVVLRRAPSLRDLKITKETYKQYESKSKEELVAAIINLQNTVHQQKEKISDLEDYIDKLLLRVLDNMPCLLTNGGSSREHRSTS